MFLSGQLLEFSDERTRVNLIGSLSDSYEKNMTFTLELWSSDDSLPVASIEFNSGYNAVSDRFYIQLLEWLSVLAM